MGKSVPWISHIQKEVFAECQWDAIQAKDMAVTVDLHTVCYLHPFYSSSIAILKNTFRLVFGACREHGQFTAVFLRRQGVSLFVSGQFPCSLVGGIMHRTLQTRSYLKNPSEARWRCYGSARNAHILPCMLRFFAAPRLALEPDPHF